VIFVLTPGEEPEERKYNTCCLNCGKVHDCTGKCSLVESVIESAANFLMYGVARASAAGGPGTFHCRYAQYTASSKRRGGTAPGIN